MSCQKDGWPEFNIMILLILH